MENTQMSKKMRQKKQKMDIGKLWGFQKWKAMVVAALLCFVGSQAMAQTSWTSTNLAAGTYWVTSGASAATVTIRKGSSQGNSTLVGYYNMIGPLTIKSGRVNIHFQNTYQVRMAGTISVQNTAQLYIYVDGANRSIIRYTDYLPMIQCLGNSSLNINPDKTYRFTIDGGAVFDTPNDGRTTYHTDSRKGELIRLHSGCNIYNTLLQNAYANNNGGALSFYEGTAYRYITLEDVEIRGIQAPYVVLLASGDHPITAGG